MAFVRCRWCCKQHDTFNLHSILGYGCSKEIRRVCRCIMFVTVADVMVCSTNQLKISSSPHNQAIIPRKRVLRCRIDPEQQQLFFGNRLPPQCIQVYVSKFSFGPCRDRRNRRTLVMLGIEIVTYGYTITASGRYMLLTIYV